MSKELWATYSVKDHLQARTFAADVMLFDRLVFPVPEQGSFPPDSGCPDELGPVAWSRNADEWARWEAQGWNPERQERFLELLKPVIRKVPWDSERDKLWREEAAKLATQQLPDYAFVATRTILTRDLPAYVEGVAALGPVYRNMEDIERELGFKEKGGSTRLPGAALPAVLEWEFLTPEDNRLSDEQLLAETVAFVAGDADFRRHRSAFRDWQQKFLKDGATDRESINRAVADMREMLEAAQTAASRLTVQKVTRYAFRIAPGALGVSLAIAGVPGGLAAAAGGAFLSLGAVAVDEWFLKSAEQRQPAPTAFVHDVRRRFPIENQP